MRCMHGLSSKEPCVEIVRAAKAHISDLADEQRLGYESICCPVIRALHKVPERDAVSFLGLVMFFHVRLPRIPVQAMCI